MAVGVEHAWLRDACLLPECARESSGPQRRALLLAYRFPPANTGISQHRPEALNRWLPACGWDPTVITAQPGPPAPNVIRLPNSTLLARLLGSNSAPTRLRRLLGSLRRRARGALQDVALRATDSLRHTAGWRDDFATWSRSIIPRAIAEGRQRRVDLVWSTSAPHSLAVTAAEVARALGVPCVLDFRDDVIFDVPAYAPSHWLHTAVTHAAAVTIAEPVAARPQFVESLHGRGPYLIFSGTWHDQPAPPQRSSVFRIVHAGYLYGELKYPALLFAALDQLARAIPEARQHVRLTFVGQDSAACTQAAGYGEVAEMVELIPQQPYLAVAKLMASAALLLIFNLERQIEQQGGLRGKLFDYLGFSSPILYVGDEPGITGELLDWVGGSSWADSLPVLTDLLMAQYRQWRERGIGEPASPGLAVSRNSEALAYLTQRRTAAEFAEVFDAVVEHRVVRCRENVPWAASMHDKAMTATAAQAAAS